MPQLTLYYAPGASSMATHIALHETGAPFALHLVDLSRQENRSPEYLAVNPEGKVPTLIIDGGDKLTEVAATLWFLARHYPAAGLLPQFGDITGEARVVSWMSFIASAIQPALQLARRGRLEGAPRSADDPCKEVFRLADTRLGGNDWAVGRYSIADIHLFRLFWRFADSLNPALGDYPNLSAHCDRMMARDAVKKTIAAESAVGDLPRH